jgi:cell division protease FtsH
MPDLPKPSDAASATTGLWRTIKKAVRRLQDWFVIQSLVVKLLVLTITILIPATGLYSFALFEKQSVVAEQVKRMAVAGNAGHGVWMLNDKLPVVFGTGSLLSFLEANPVARISVIYKPLLWDVSERTFLIESRGHAVRILPERPGDPDLRRQGRHRTVGRQAGLHSARRTRRQGAGIDRAPGPAFFPAPVRSPPRTAGKAGVSGVLSVALTLGLLAFLYFQFKGQFKSLKFIEPAQVHGSIEELVGMDDIKAEVAQIKDQYQRRAAYAEYGISKPFNVMFSGPAGTGKTRLASYLAKELRLPILFHSAANLETGYVAGGSNTLSRIMAMAKRRKHCIVFLDEAQDLFMKRGGRRKFDDDTANTLLSVLDGVRSRNDAEIIWIVASNFNSESMRMDEAMLRRFQMKVDFRLPNRDERLAILGHYLAQRANKVLPDLDLRHLVEVTEGRSPADLETIVNQARNHGRAGGVK